MVALRNQASLSFDEFLEWYPEASDYRYVLRRGMVDGEYELQQYYPSSGSTPNSRKR